MSIRSRKMSQVSRISIRPCPSSSLPTSLGGASRVLCRKLSRSLHLSWTWLHGSLLLPLPPKYTRKLRDVSGRTVPREECLKECWSFLVLWTLYCVCATVRACDSKPILCMYVGYAGARKRVRLNSLTPAPPLSYGTRLISYCSTDH